MTDFNQYLKMVAVEKDQHPEWRMGQTYFNVLIDISPSFCETFRDTEADPFYDDSRIGEFLTQVWNKWDVVFWWKRR